MREPNPEKVKRAIRRIAVIMEPSDGVGKPSSIWTSDSEWRWKVGGRPDEPTTWCDTTHPDAVKEAIENLKEPQ